MTKKAKTGGTGMPPHRPRPLAVPQDLPAERIDLPYGLSVEIHLCASGTCSFCERQMSRISADEGLCTACTDRWGTSSDPRKRAS